MPLTFADRAHGALLGLALGDAYGRSLEFTALPAARTQPVAMPSADFMWTDDTHMALYLAEAIEAWAAADPRRLDPSQCHQPFEADRFGEAVGAAFVRWAADPFTPHTAPGNTCLAGAAAFQRHGDWRRSGVAHSDGCGAVMRITPLPMVLGGEALCAAAAVQARVTHAHPNGPEASVAACLLLERLLAGQPWGPTLVAASLDDLRARPDALPGSPTAAALAAALAWAALGQDPGTEDWLDEAAIPEGDGGWRSPSALGLAVAAALRWGAEPRLALEKAARIAGDSDSVAALAGTLLGAAVGASGLPADWLAALPQADMLRATTARLLALRP